MAGLQARQLVVSSEELGESPLLPALAILSSAALYATLPSRFIAGPSSGVFSLARWIVPGLTVLLLVALVVSVPQGRLVRSMGLRTTNVRIGRRVAALGVTAIVSAANAAAIVLLVHLLVSGAHAQARLLLRAGIHMWCLNVLVFALWFWELDNGGPAARRTAAPAGRDFLFPQQTLPRALAGGLAAPLPRLPLRFVHQRDRVQPHRRDAAQSLGEDVDAGGVDREPGARDHGRRPRHQHPEIAGPARL